MNVKIGNRLYLLRKRNNVSQEALAKQTHYSQCTISRIENGRKEVQIKELLAFAKALKEPVIYFLSDL